MQAEARKVSRDLQTYTQNMNVNLKAFNREQLSISPRDLSIIRGEISGQRSFSQTKPSHPDFSRESI